VTLRSPLHDEHVRLGAKIIEFGGWDMPLQFRGVIAEHNAVRERAGLFDVSHLGKLIVEGPDAASALDAFLPGKVAALSEWTAGYNLVLTEEGGIIDDIFVYRRPEKFVVVPNAANAEAVLEALQSGLTGDVRVSNARERWAILALQGPLSRNIVEPLLPGANEMKLHGFSDMSIDGIESQVARTGYTGEYGFEFFVPWGESPKVWRLLLDRGEEHGLLPTGLGARDTLRLEMGFALYGHEISMETNPLEASLGWVINWEKPTFKGRESLQRIRETGIDRKLVGFVSQGREIPRQGYRVLSDDQDVGEVVSGNFSPVLGRGIATAYVLKDFAQPGMILTVDVRGKKAQVEVTTPPFIKRKPKEE